jgi:nucleoside-diphosphate-sugar epimerase
MPNYLVVGGAGFIGSHLTHRLVQQGETVTVFDNLSTGTQANLEAVARHITFRKGDIRNKRALQAAMKGTDIVFHQAAITSVPQSIEDPATTAEINIQGTINVLQAAHECGIKQVVFASSSAIYGDQVQGVVQESLPPLPLSPYGISKLAGEHYCRVFSEVYDLPTVCLRYFNVFGPRQNYKGGYAAVIPLLISQLLQQESPTIEWHGRQSRDFTYVDNIVEANILAARSQVGNGEAINIGSGKATTINSLVIQLQKILRTYLTPRHVPQRKGDILHSCARITKAKRVLHYQPHTSFSEGLKETVDWYQRTREQYPVL